MSRNDMNKLFEDVVNLKVVIFGANFQNIGNISRPRFIQKNEISPTPFTTSLPQALLRSDGIHRKSKTYTTCLSEDISESNGIKWTCNPIKFYMDIEIKNSNVYLSFFIIDHQFYPVLSGDFKVWIEDKEHEKVSCK
uniref:Uncharacterized protein n=1 Tax=Panagrolaimus superbus TaxID=310955 RepID=A0A914YBX3_9BILA